MSRVAAQIASAEESVLAEFLVEHIRLLRKEHRRLQTLLNESGRLLLLLRNNIFALLRGHNLEHGRYFNLIVISLRVFFVFVVSVGEYGKWIVHLWFPSAEASVVFFFFPGARNFIERVRRGTTRGPLARKKNLQREGNKRCQWRHNLCNTP